MENESERVKMTVKSNIEFLVDKNGLFDALFGKESVGGNATANKVAFNFGHDESGNLVYVGRNPKLTNATFRLNFSLKRGYEDITDLYIQGDATEDARRALIETARLYNERLGIPNKTINVYERESAMSFERSLRDKLSK